MNIIFHSPSLCTGREKGKISKKVVLLHLWTSRELGQHGRTSVVEWIVTAQKGKNSHIVMPLFPPSLLSSHFSFVSLISPGPSLGEENIGW